MASPGEWKERKRQSKGDHNRRHVKDEEEEEDEAYDQPKKETSGNWDTSFRRAQRQRARELIQDAQSVFPFHYQHLTTLPPHPSLTPFSHLSFITPLPLVSPPARTS